MSRRRQRTFLILIPVLAVVAVGVWLNALGGSDPADQPSGLDPAALAPPDPGPNAVGGADAFDGNRLVSAPDRPVAGDGARVPTTVAFPLEVELSLVSTGGEDLDPSVPAPGSGASATLSGSLSNHLGQPDRGRVLFRSGPNEGRVLDCDSTGAFGASNLYPGMGVVRLEASNGMVAEREVILRALDRTLLNVSFSAPATVAGRVVDLMGEPLQGATVRLDGGTTRTDAEGGFLFPRIASGRNILCVVEAEGKARHRELISIERGGAIAEDRLTFRLKPGVALEVTIAEVLGARQPAYVYLFPAGGVSAVQHDFPWEEVSPLRITPGSRVRVEGLPPVNLTLVPFHSGAVGMPPQVNQKLFEGRLNQVVLHLAPGPSLSGVVRVDGEPAPGATVRLEAPDRGVASTKALGRRPTFNQETIVPHVPAALQEVTADHRGRFTFTLFPSVEESWYLSGETRGGTHAGRALVRQGDADVTLDLQPVSGGSGELTFDLPGRWQGLPVHLRVQGAPRDPFVVRPGEDLVVSDLTPGLWRVDATWRGRRLLLGNVVSVPEKGGARVAATLPEEAIEGPPRPKETVPDGGAGDGDPLGPGGR